MSEQGARYRVIVDEVSELPPTWLAVLSRVGVGLTEAELTEAEREANDGRADVRLAEPPPRQRTNWRAAFTLACARLAQAESVASDGWALAGRVGTLRQDMQDVLDGRLRLREEDGR